MRPLFGFTGYKITNDWDLGHFEEFFSRFFDLTPKCFSNYTLFKNEATVNGQRFCLSFEEMANRSLTTTQLCIPWQIESGLEVLNFDINHYPSIFSRAEIIVMDDIPVNILEYPDWETRLVKTRVFQEMEQGFSRLLENDLIDLFIDEFEECSSGKPFALYLFSKFQRDRGLKRLANRKRGKNIDQTSFFGKVKTVLDTHHFPKMTTQADDSNLMQDIDRLLMENYSVDELNGSLALIGTTANQWFN